ncbi:MAG: iron-sulfur cluster assembly accessory protein [Bacteroidia bacterium]|nr:iron-sulfur cluster assembly accessory protein [Bacteroidia bacterium]
MKTSFIIVTDNAKRHIEKLRQDGGYSEEHGLRVSVDGGGCSGLVYKLDFDSSAQPGDQVFEDNGVRLMVNMKSLLYLAGTELDFTGGLKGEGFHFNNPNASRTCACGESFSV